MDASNISDISQLPRDLQHKHLIWQKESKQKLFTKASSNIQKRAHQVNESVNNAVSILHHKLSITTPISHQDMFILDHILTSETIESVKLVFESWNGVNYRACKSVPASESKYWEIADNWYVIHCIYIYIYIYI